MVKANLSELEAAEQRKREVVDMVNDVLEHYVLKQQVPENRFFEFESLSKGKYFLSDLKERDGTELSEISVASFLELMSEPDKDKNKIRNTCPIVLTQDMDLTGRTIIAKNLFIYDPGFSLKADRIIADNIILYGGSLKADSVTALFGAMFAHSFVVADEFSAGELLTFDSSFIANKFMYGATKRRNSFQYNNSNGNITLLYDNVGSNYGGYFRIDLTDEVEKTVKSHRNNSEEYKNFIFDTKAVDALIKRLDVAYKQVAACSISSILMSGASDSMTPPAMEVVSMETGATASSSTIDEIF